MATATWRCTILRHTLVALLIVAGCKKKKPPEKGPDVVEIQKVEAPLQVTAIHPPDAPEASVSGVSASIFGSGFEDGALVVFGATSASDVLVVDPNTIEVRLPALGAGTYDVVVSSGGGSTTLREGFTVTAQSQDEVDCSLATVRFGYNSASLDSGPRGRLDDHVPCYQKRTGTVKISGHADQRGTTDYNLALGQRRAEMVKRHLLQQGVSKSRLQTVSFGEEQPVDRSANEAAFAKNRRAEVESR